MKNNYKVIALIFMLVLITAPVISIFGEGEDFLNSDFVKNIIETAKEFEDGKFELEIVKLEKAESSKEFFNAKAIYKLQTDVKVTNQSFIGTSGKKFTALFIDKDGVFDLGEYFFDENSKSYTPIITNGDNKYQTFYGTATGKHYLIAVLSDEIPYFGNMYNNRGGKNPNALKRYIEHLKKELEEKEASVYITEYDINPNELD